MEQMKAGGSRMTVHKFKNIFLLVAPTSEFGQRVAFFCRDGPNLLV